MLMISELYVDINRKVYKKIGFKRYNYLGIIRYLFSRDGWAAYQKVGVIATQRLFVTVNI